MIFWKNVNLKLYTNELCIIKEKDIVKLPAINSPKQIDTKNKLFY